MYCGTARPPLVGLKPCRSATGASGAMILGGVQDERIQFNGYPIWVGEKRDRNNPEGAGTLAEVRPLLFAAKI